ncbi:MAG: YgjV family protein [bacterium]|nr:YgjV family protein [bacterium]
MSNFIIQFIGFVAWLFLVASYWRKKVNDVLILQVISCILFAIHYYLLGAMSGLYIVLFEAIRDFIYYKSDNDLKLFYCSLPIYVLIAVFCFNGIASVLPSLASLIDGFSLTGKKKFVVVGGILSYLVWIVYDFFCHSYVGMVTNFILVCSNILVLIKSFFEQKKVN